MNPAQRPTRAAIAASLVALRWLAPAVAAQQQPSTKKTSERAHDKVASKAEYGMNGTVTVQLPKSKRSELVDVIQIELAAGAQPAAAAEAAAAPRQ